MSKQNIELEYTSCPFCKTGRKENEKVCRVCGLNYDELKDASNKQAKKRSLTRKPFESLEDEIIYTHIAPKDVDMPTVKTLTYLFGLFGINNIYVGKFFKGIAFMLIALAGLVMALIYYVTKGQTYLNIASLLLVIAALSWVIDITMLSTKKFKFPVKLVTNIDLDKFYKENKKQKVNKK